MNGSNEYTFWKSQDSKEIDMNSKFNSLWYKKKGTKEGILILSSVIALKAIFRDEYQKNKFWV